MFMLMTGIHGATACSSSDKLLFAGAVEDNALKEFFGNTRGSYLEQDQLMTLQMDALLEVDYAADGQFITEMPSLRDGTYLDIGAEHHSEYPNDMTAIIMSPCGMIKAVAIYWQKSSLPSGYGSGPVYLTIFMPQNQSALQKKRIKTAFENFGDLANQASSIGAISFQTKIHRLNLWSDNFHAMAIPINIVYLKVGRK
jgi:hypothetical protein